MTQYSRRNFLKLAGAAVGAFLARLGVVSAEEETSVSTQDVEQKKAVEHYQWGATWEVLDSMPPLRAAWPMDNGQNVFTGDIRAGGVWNTVLTSEQSQAITDAMRSQDPLWYHPTPDCPWPSHASQMIDGELVQVYPPEEEDCLLH